MLGYEHFFEIVPMLFILLWTRVVVICRYAELGYIIEEHTGLINAQKIRVMVHWPEQDHERTLIRFHRRDSRMEVDVRLEDKQ